MCAATAFPVSRENVSRHVSVRPASVAVKTPAPWAALGRRHLLGGVEAGGQLDRRAAAGEAEAGEEESGREDGNRDEACACRFLR